MVFYVFTFNRGTLYDNPERTDETTQSIRFKLSENVLISYYQS